MSYFIESIDEVIEEIQPLLEAHYHEIAHFKDIPLKPDWVKYRQAELANILRIFTARKWNNALIGYEVFFVTPNLHYSDHTYASQDILFLMPEHRRGRLGRDLTRFSNDCLKTQGVNVVLRHVKDKHNHGAMLERDGAELMDHIYALRLQ